MAKAKSTLICAVLDRSGSMAGVKLEAMSGFDQFIKEQQQVPGKCQVSLMQFDTDFDRVYSATPIADVPPMELVPRGMTALLDAVGKTIVELELDIAAAKKKPEKVIVVIITDGGENSSHEYTRQQVRDMVLRAQERGWDFTFIGSNIDAFTVGGDIGIRKDSTLQSNDASVRGAYASMSSAVSTSRASGEAMSYTDAHRHAAVSGSAVPPPNTTAAPARGKEVLNPDPMWKDGDA